MKQHQMDPLDKSCEKGRKQKKWASPSNFIYSKKSRYKIPASIDNFEFFD